MHKAYLEANIKTILWPDENFPLYGMTLSHMWTPYTCYSWLRSTPEARARYFKNTPAWDATPNDTMYCPSFVIHDPAGRQRFENLVETTYFMMSRQTPEAEVIALDWETQVWLSKDNTPGKGSWCFCDNCKKRFKEFIKQPGELDDDAIMKEHYTQWIDFRSALEGELQGLIRDIVHKKLSKRYMVYAEASNRPFWKACKGKIDLAFPGLPGNAMADGQFQKQLDECMEFYRKECGIDRIISQRFSYSGFSVKPDGWKQFVALSNDGFVDARSWKSQVLRLVATCNGGIDLESGMELCGGMLYYVGEATRIIAEHEELFYEGRRDDALASSEQFKYPNLLVLKKGDERLVLLFNETDKPVETELLNNGLPQGMAATIHGEAGSVGNPERIKLTVPPGDVAVIHVKKDDCGFLGSLF